MIRKFFVLSAILIAVMALCIGNVEAANKAKAATLSNSPTPPGGISDVSSGDCVEVDSSGRIYTRDMGGHTISSGWGDRLVYTGACVVYDVIVQGQDADAYAAVFDAITATGTAKLDPQSATAKKVEGVRVSGAAFATGIYVSTGDSGNTLTTVVYDPI